MTPLVRLPAELVPRLPAPVRGVLRGTVRGYGRATVGLRPLPDFLIIGAQKAGTTALYAYLRWHPEITGPSFKEVSFFDRHYTRGPAWYRAHLPARPRQWPTRLRNGRWPSVGEASPSYLFHPLAPERVASLMPWARLIAVLRNPVDRAFSHYQHEVALGREPLSFEDALDAEEERMRGELERMAADPSYFSHAWWNYTYASRGRYAEQLERWYASFPREQVLVVLSDELSQEPDETYARVLDFLGVRPYQLSSFPRIFSREYDEMPAATRARLETEFAEPNQALAELLGRELPWQDALAVSPVRDPSNW
jgi:sulfotransferase family protein